MKWKIKTPNSMSNTMQNINNQAARQNSGQRKHPPSPRLRAWHDEHERALVFPPLAWLKLKFFCHAGETEVGGFAISSAADPLYVQDFVTVRQATTAVTVEF